MSVVGVRVGFCNVSPTPSVVSGLSGGSSKGTAAASASAAVAAAAADASSPSVASVNPCDRFKSGVHLFCSSLAAAAAAFAIACASRARRASASPRSFSSASICRRDLRPESGTDSGSVCVSFSVKRWGGFEGVVISVSSGNEDTGADTGSAGSGARSLAFSFAAAALAALPTACASFFFLPPASSGWFKISSNDPSPLRAKNRTRRPRRERGSKVFLVPSSPEASPSTCSSSGVVGAAGDVEGPASVVSIADACVTGFFVGVKGVVGEVIADDKHDANASQVRRSR